MRVLRQLEAAKGLRGERVLLVPFGPDDITPEYLDWLNDPRVVRFSNQRFRRHAVPSAKEYLASFAGSSNLFLSIRMGATNAPIGTMTAYISDHHGTADCGILIGNPSAWGQGLGQDAWNTLTEWLLAQDGIRKLTAGCLAPNLGMVRLMERSGMHLEATRRAQEIFEGRPENILLYARFRP